jgi:uncharacterized protein
MAKIFFLLAAIFAVLFVLRISNAKRRAPPPPRDAATPTGEAMVRCAVCGVFVPRSEAIESNGAYHCRSGHCAPGR